MLILFVVFLCGFTHGKTQPRVRPKIALSNGKTTANMFWIAQKPMWEPGISPSHLTISPKQHDFCHIPQLSNLNFKKTTVSSCCSWIAAMVTLLPALFYLYPVRGWHCSCRSPCRQIQWRVAWGVSSQWSGCVRSWWGAVGSGSTGWRSGSVPRQDQLWQCVWQWDLVRKEQDKLLVKRANDSYSIFQFNWFKPKSSNTTLTSTSVRLDHFVLIQLRFVIFLINLNI